MKLEIADISIIGWLLKNGIRTENGKPFDLKSHPFWYDVLTDWNERIVMLKAAQGGGTILFLLKSLFAIPRFGLNSVYTMPTASDVQDLVSGKLNPMIANNPALQDLIKDKDSVEQKRIGKFTMYFKGTWTERAALSFSSDLNIHDEEDRSKLPIIEQYASRQQHSAFKWNWRFSNPSFPGVGVAKYWSMSDQKHWFIKCSRCSKRQFLSWPDSIENGSYICKHCRKPLSEKDRMTGEWIGAITKTKPDYSGYWFNLMMAPWVPASEIVKLHQTKSDEYFHNFVLGLPYAGNGAKLIEEDFFQNLDSSKNQQQDPIVIGVDTGLPIYYVVGNKQGLFYQGSCDTMSEIEALMRRFPKSIVVCDQGGDLTAPRELQQKYPSRFFLCWFREDRKSMRLIEWGQDKEHGKVIADRNRCISQMMDELRDRRMRLNGSKEDWWPVWLHFANMYKEVEQDELGREKFVWKRSGPDHLALATLYWRIGMDKFSNIAEKKYVQGGGDYHDWLDVQPSWENYDNTMPSRFPHTETAKDWRDIE